jgi:hypothetical protein
MFSAGKSSSSPMAKELNFDVAWIDLKMHREQQGLG